MLILNAGVLFPSPDALTAQGYDATFGVNIVGHFLLHRLLYPLLSASGRESDPSRVIWLSSMASYKPHRITYDAFREGPVRRRMDPFDLYSESKVGAVMLSTYLAKTCPADNVASIAVDPGYIKSEIYRSSPWYLKLFVRPPMHRSYSTIFDIDIDLVRRIGFLISRSNTARSGPCTQALRRKVLGSTEK